MKKGSKMFILGLISWLLIGFSSITTLAYVKKRELTATHAVISALGGPFTTMTIAVVAIKRTCRPDTKAPYILFDFKDKEG